MKIKTFKSSLLVLLTIFSFYSQAQTADSVLKSDQFKLNAKWFGIGASYERRLSESFTVFSELGIRSAHSTYVTTYREGGWDVLNAEAGIEGRYYYNLKKRWHNKKPTQNNSANF